MIDEVEFNKWFFALMLAKGKGIDGEMARTWYEFLKDFPSEQIESAFKKCVYSPDDFPTVGKIIEMIQPIKAQAIEAWLTVLRTAEKDKTPTGEVGKIIEKMGGINRIGYCENEYEMSQLQRQFIEMYETKQDEIRLEQLDHNKPKEIT